MSLISFSLFALIASITPGPANIAILSVSAASPFRVGVLFVVGICIGLSVVLLASLLPLMGLVTISLNSFLVNTIKIGGACFLLYISYQLYKRNSLSSNKKIGFLHGLIIHPTSIKAWAFVLSAYTLFIDAESFNTITGLIYASIFLLISFFSHSTWLLLGLIIKNKLSEKKIIFVNKILSLSLAATVIYMFIL